MLLGGLASAWSRGGLPASLLRVAVLTCRPGRLSQQPRSCASQSEQPAELELPELPELGGPSLVLPPLTFDKPLQRGAVHFVSTPIGNLEDITLRAIRTLREADVIATEDPKVTAPLLRKLGVERKAHPLVTHNDNNLERSVPRLVEYALQGLLVAVVSDAGTPAISDPGLGLAAQCAERGVPTVPVPGPCAAIAAVTVSGFDCSEFLYVGFVSRGSAEKAKARRRLREIATEARPVVLYEAPHRLLATLGELSAAGAGARGCLCARELTKRHEELRRGTVDSVSMSIRMSMSISISISMSISMSRKAGTAAQGHGETVVLYHTGAGLVHRDGRARGARARRGDARPRAPRRRGPAGARGRTAAQPRRASRRRAARTARGRRPRVEHGQAGGRRAGRAEEGRVRAGAADLPGECRGGHRVNPGVSFSTTRVTLFQHTFTREKGPKFPSPRLMTPLLGKAGRQR